VSNPIEDKDFDEYLNGRSQVSRQYRDLDSAEVPSHLDDAILAQARDAVSSKSSRDELAALRGKRTRLMRWAVPTTLAACSLLVVSIVIRSGSQHEVKPQQMAVSAQVAAPSTPEAKTRAGTVDGVVHADKDKEQVILIAPPRNAVTEFSPLAASSQQAAARSREEKKRLSAQADSERMRQELRERMSIAPPPPITSADQTVASSAPVESALQAPAPMPAAPAAPIARQEAQDRSDTPAEEEDISEIAVTGVPQKAASPRMSGPRGTINAARSADASAENEAPNYESPEAWLEHIRQLRREGHIADADREWREFRKKHPDVVVEENDLARGSDRG
jgi:resuscitation-promoting factor RpfA